MSINIDHLSFGYGDNLIFDQLSLSLPDTGFVVILGPSGSGKTTFLSLLSGLLKPQKGSITGTDTRQSSIVFQSPLLLDYLTVEENISLPLLLQGMKKKETSSLIKPVLERLELTSLKDQYPYHLSGGEQVRVSIARGLIKGGKTLILDEPTGQLDEKNSTVIYQILKDLSKDHLILLVTHDETSGIRLADYLFRLEHKSLVCLKKGEENQYTKPVLPTPDKGKFTIDNAIYLNSRYLIHKKVRTILSTLFLAFNMMLIYLGLNLNSHMDESMNSLLKEYYACEVTNVSMKEEVASSGKLHLTKNSIPNEEVMSLLDIKDPYYCLNYFLPTYQEISLHDKVVDVSFYPVIKEDSKRLAYGHTLTRLEDIIVNDSFLEEVKLDRKQAIGKKIAIHHQALLYSKQLESSDSISLDITFQIVGISKEKKAFNKPCIYYSYQYCSDYLKSHYLENISEELGIDTTAFDLLNNPSYDEDDFKANGILCYQKDISHLKENAKRFFKDRVSISSQALDVKESTKDIISSLLKVLTLFVILNTICSLMLEFLAVYSLYADNIRLFALIKTFTRNKRNTIKSALGLQLIFLFLILSSSLVLSLLSSYLINTILNALQYPSFLSLSDINSFLFVILISFFCSFFGSLLPLRKIKDKDINQELEGED